MELQTKMTNIAHIIRQLARETRGVEIAETAAVLPVLFLIVMGIFWFGEAFRMYSTVTRAAQEGARAGAAPGCSTCGGPNTPAQYAANAVSALNNALTAANLDPSQVHAPAPRPNFPNSCGGPTTCIAVGGSNACVQGPVWYSNSPGGAGVCGISVSFRYPFKFHVPFASPTIYLPASARVHMETQ